jgi:hypothetical protein
VRCTFPTSCACTFPRISRRTSSNRSGKNGDRRRGDRHAAPTGSWSGSHRRLRFRVLRRQACYDDPRTGSRCRLSLHIEQPCLSAG